MQNVQKIRTRSHGTGIELGANITIRKRGSAIEEVDSRLLIRYVAAEETVQSSAATVSHDGTQKWGR